jgi:RNA polymerase sigma factor (sigma-70 family)
MEGSLMWYTDEQGRFFKIVNGMAAYIGKLKHIPHRHRQATEFEKTQAEIRHNSVWKLVIDHLDLHKHICMKFNVSEFYAFNVLINAARLYNPKKGKFSTYAWIAMRRARRELTSAQDSTREKSYLQKLELDNSDELEYIMSQLSEYDQYILQLRHIHELTFEELGDLIGVSKSTAKYQCTNAMKRARSVRRS